MPRSSNEYFSFVLFSLCSALIALGIFVGCSKTDLPSTSTGGGSGGSTGTTTPVGTVDDSAGFYVKAREISGVTYDTHKSTAFSTSCTASKNESITCWIEGQEQDLYQKGMTLQYNVPSTMCSYVIEYPYWYRKLDYGDGATTATVSVDKNGASGVDSDNDGVVDSALTCTYDYTSSGGPNCCTGKYTKTTRTWDTGTSAYVVSSITAGVPWGGNWSGCTAGPGSATQPKSTKGRPLSVSYFVESTGLNKTYDIAAPISTPRATNLWIANWFDVGGVTPTPLAVTGHSTANPYYVYQCLDHAFEVVAEIKVLIRDWNTSDQFALRATTGDPDITGNEANPPNGTGLFNYKDDWWDWKALVDEGYTYPGLIDD